MAKRKPARQGADEPEATAAPKPAGKTTPRKGSSRAAGEPAPPAAAGAKGAAAPKDRPKKESAAAGRGRGRARPEAPPPTAVEQALDEVTKLARAVADEALDAAAPSPHVVPEPRAAPPAPEAAAPRDIDPFGLADLDLDDLAAQINAVSGGTFEADSLLSELESFEPVPAPETRPKSAPEPLRQPVQEQQPAAPVAGDFDEIDGDVLDAAALFSSVSAPPARVPPPPPAPPARPPPAPPSEVLEIEGEPIDPFAGGAAVIETPRPEARAPDVTPAPVAAAPPPAAPAIEALQPAEAPPAAAARTVPPKAPDGAGAATHEVAIEVPAGPAPARAGSTLEALDEALAGEVDDLLGGDFESVGQVLDEHGAGGAAVVAAPPSAAPARTEVRAAAPAAPPAKFAAPRPAATQAAAAPAATAMSDGDDHDAPETESAPRAPRGSPLVAFLQALNYPLRLLPPPARMLVDWLGITLLAWVVIVWAVVWFNGRN